MWEQKNSLETPLLPRAGRGQTPPRLRAPLGPGTAGAQSREGLGGAGCSPPHTSPPLPGRRGPRSRRSGCLARHARTRDGASCNPRTLHPPSTRKAGSRGSEHRGARPGLGTLTFGGAVCTCGS